MYLTVNLQEKIGMITNKISLISSKPSHRQAIVQLLEAVKLPVTDLPSDLTNFFVAVDGKKVIGVAGLEIYGDHALLRSLAVDPAYRNQNIAEQLLLQVEDRARQLKLSAIYLLTETARGYFEKKGFETIQREEVPPALKQSSEFSHTCPASAILMLKNIAV